MKLLLALAGLVIVGGCKPRADSSLSDVGSLVQTERHRLVTEVARSHKTRVGSMSHADSVSANGHSVVISADDSGKVVIMNTKKNAVQFDFQIPRINGAQVTDTAVAQSSRYAAVAFDGVGLYILDLASKGIYAQFLTTNDFSPDKLAFVAETRSSSGYLAVTQKDSRVIKLIDISSKKLVSNRPMRSSHGGNSQRYADIFALGGSKHFAAVVDDRIEVWFYDASKNQGQCHTHIGVSEVNGGKPKFTAKKCSEPFPRSNNIFGHFTTAIAKRGKNMSSAGFGGSVPEYTLAAGTDNGYVFVIDSVIVEAGNFEVVDGKTLGFEGPLLVLRKPSSPFGPSGDYSAPAGATTMFAPGRSTYTETYQHNSGSLRCRNLTEFSGKRLDPRPDFQAITGLDFGRFTRSDADSLGNWRDKSALVVTAKDGTTKILSIGNFDTRLSLAISQTTFEPGGTPFIVRHRENDVTLGVLHSLFLGQNTLISSAVFVSHSDILLGTGNGRMFVWHTNATEKPINIGSHVPAGEITYLTVSRDGKYVAAADTNWNVVVWDSLAEAQEPQSARDVPFGQTPRNAAVQRAIANRKSEGKVTSLQFSPAGDKVLYADGKTHVWTWGGTPADADPVGARLVDEPRQPSGDELDTGGQENGDAGQAATNGVAPTGFVEVNGLRTIDGQGHRVALWSHRGDLVFVGTETGQVLTFDAQSGEQIGSPLEFSDQPIVSIALHSDPNCESCVAVMDKAGAIGFGTLEEAKKSFFQMPGALEDNNTVKSTSFRGGLGLSNSLDYYLDGTAFYVAVNFSSGKSNYVAVQPDYLYANNNVRNNSSGDVTQATFAHKPDNIIGLHVFKEKRTNEQGQEVASELLYVATENDVEVWDPLTCQLVRKFDLGSVGRIKVTGMTNQDEFLVTGSDKGQLDIWHLQNEFKLSDLVSGGEQ